MARIRSVHPEQWSDEDFVSLSFPARLLAISIRNECDDKGVFIWKPLTIKMRLFPADNVNVESLLIEMVEADMIRRYEIGGKSYGAVRNFRKFQRPKKPNDVYPITSELRTYVGLDDGGSEPVGNQSTTSGEIEPQMEDGGEGKGESYNGGGSARARASPVDPMIDQVVEDAQADVKREGWYDFNVAAALKRWRDLGLGDEEIRTVVRTLTEKKRDGPAKGPAYFDEAMARAAGAKQQPGLAPINGGARHGGSRRTASEHRKIRETEADAHFVADLEGWGEGGSGAS